MPAYCEPWPVKRNATFGADPDCTVAARAAFRLDAVARRSRSAVSRSSRVAAGDRDAMVEVLASGVRGCSTTSASGRSG